MKNLLLASMLILFPLLAGGEEFRFAQLETDEPSYTVGEKGFIFIHTDRLPENPEAELHLDVRFQSQNVNVVKVSNTLAVAQPARFSEAGEFELELQVKQQNGTTQRALEAAVALYLTQIEDLQRKLQNEHDPENKAVIEQDIAFRQGRMNALRERMELQRTLLEIDRFTVEVAAVKMSAQNPLSLRAVLQLTKSRIQEVQGAWNSAKFEEDRAYFGIKLRELRALAASLQEKINLSKSKAL